MADPQAITDRQIADPITDMHLEKLRRLLDQATVVGSWHWSGNIDTGEPYLACWVPGAGRCTILGLGWRERSTTGRTANDYRGYLAENGDTPAEIEAEIKDWATDKYDVPIKEPELWLYDDMLAVPARSRAIFEVAPLAITRDDPKVYRADIVGLRHPDATLIVDGINALPGLLARLDAAEAALEQLALEDDLEGNDHGE